MPTNALEENAKNREDSYLFLGNKTMRHNCDKQYCLIKMFETAISILDGILDNDNISTIRFRH